MKNLFKRIFCIFLAVVFTVLLCIQAEASGNVIYSGADGCGKRIAITFDDGPHPVWTEKLLEYLIFLLKIQFAPHFLSLAKMQNIIQIL